MQMCATFLKFFHTFMDDYEDIDNEKVKLSKDINDLLLNYIFFSLIWSFGGCLEESCRKQFNSLIYDIIAGKDVENEYKIDI